MHTPWDVHTNILACEDFGRQSFKLKGSSHPRCIIFHNLVVNFLLNDMSEENMRERTASTAATLGVDAGNAASDVQRGNGGVMIPEGNRYLNAQNYTLGVKADMKSLSKFVREELFYVFVHDFKNEDDDCLALACEEFVEYCLEPDNKKSITNPHIQTATVVEFKAYLRFLWKEGLKTNLKGRGNIRKDLSHEKSAVYASIADAFKSE